MTKSILITGGAGKVGKQLVYHFANIGFEVVFTSRSEQNIKEIEQNQENILGIKVDFLEKEYLQKISNALKEKGIKINYLINNARSLDFLKVEEDNTIKRENWINEYLVDVVVPYELSVNLERSMPLKKIINIASVYGVVPHNPNLYEENNTPFFQYSCAKAALIHLTKELSIQFSCKGIQVNSISYGGIEGRVNEEFKKNYSNLCPLKRMMKEEEVTGVIDFLISDSSEYITGQNIVVDGGWSVW